MKLSLCQMVAIFCIFAVGFITIIGPIALNVQAHGDRHLYQATVFVVKTLLCTDCGVPIGTTVINSYQTTASHPDGKPHANFDQNVGSEERGLCLGCAYSSN